MSGNYSFVEWRDVEGERAYAHPWCAIWSVSKDDGTEPPSTIECRNCGRELPLRSWS